LLNEWLDDQWLDLYTRVKASRLSNTTTTVSSETTRVTNISSLLSSSINHGITSRRIDGYLPIDITLLTNLDFLLSPSPSPMIDDKESSMSMSERLSRSIKFQRRSVVIRMLPRYLPLLQSMHSFCKSVAQLTSLYVKLKHDIKLLR
jgi:hypothetical protein